MHSGPQVSENKGESKDVTSQVKRTATSDTNIKKFEKSGLPEKYFNVVMNREYYVTEMIDALLLLQKNNLLNDGNAMVIHHNFQSAKDTATTMVKLNNFNLLNDPTRSWLMQSLNIDQTQVLDSADILNYHGQLSDMNWFLIIGHFRSTSFTAEVLCNLAWTNSLNIKNQFLIKTNIHNINEIHSVLKKLKDNKLLNKENIDHLLNCLEYIKAINKTLPAIFNQDFFNQLLGSDLKQFPIDSSNKKESKQESKSEITQHSNGESISESSKQKFKASGLPLEYFRTAMKSPHYVAEMIEALQFLKEHNLLNPENTDVVYMKHMEAAGTAMMINELNKYKLLNDISRAWLIKSSGHDYSSVIDCFNLLNNNSVEESWPTFISDYQSTYYMANALCNLAQRNLNTKGNRALLVRNVEYISDIQRIFQLLGQFLTQDRFDRLMHSPQYIKKLTENPLFNDNNMTKFDEALDRLAVIPTFLQGLHPRLGAGSTLFAVCGKTENGEKNNELYSLDVIKEVTRFV